MTVSIVFFLWGVMLSGPFLLGVWQYIQGGKVDSVQDPFRLPGPRSSEP